MAVNELRGSLESLPAVKCAGEVLNKIFEYDSTHAPRQVTLLNQAPERSIDDTIHGPLKPRHFHLHSVPDVSYKQQVQLLCGILQGLPLPFQLLRCTNKTTEEELSLFFQRISSFREHKYVILGVNHLTGDIQEVSEI